MGAPGPGHRPRHRPGAGPHAARHDDRLRRQPHVHPRRVRRAGLRHRHERGRARARHPDPPPAAGPARWPSPSTATCRPARPPRTSSSPSSAASAPAAASATIIEYRGRPIRGALDGGPHDRLQHVDRGGRQGRPDRARRHDVRLPRGPRPRPEGSRTGRRRWTTGARSSTDDGATFDREVHLDAADIAAPRLLGHQPRPGRADRRRASPTRTTSPTPSDARVGGPGARVHGPHRRHRRSATSRVDTVFIGIVHQLAASRTCGRAAAVARRPPGDGSARAHARRARQPTR